MKPHKIASHMHTRDLQRKDDTKLRSEQKFFTENLDLMIVIIGERGDIYSSL